MFISNIYVGWLGGPEPKTLDDHGMVPPAGLQRPIFHPFRAKRFCIDFASIQRCTEKGVAVRLVRLFDALGVPTVVFHCGLIVFFNVGPVGHFGAQERRRIDLSSILGHFWNPRGGPRGPNSTPNRSNTCKTERQDASRGLPGAPRRLQVASKTLKAPKSRQNSKMQGTPMVFQRF